MALQHLLAGIIAFGIVSAMAQRAGWWWVASLAVGAIAGLVVVLVGSQIA